MTAFVTQQSQMADGGSSIAGAVMRERAGVGPCVHASEPHDRVNGVRYALGTYLPVVRRMTRRVHGDCNESALMLM